MYRITVREWKREQPMESAREVFRGDVKDNGHGERLCSKEHKSRNEGEWEDVYLAMRCDPGIFSSKVARTAPFALASLLK
jgi:hypothetical protein